MRACVCVCKRNVFTYGNRTQSSTDLSLYSYAVSFLMENNGVASKIQTLAEWRLHHRITVRCCGGGVYKLIKLIVCRSLSICLGFRRLLLLHFLLLLLLFLLLLLLLLRRRLSTPLVPLLVLPLLVLLQWLALMAAD